MTLPPVGPEPADALTVLCDILARFGHLTVALADPDRIGGHCGVVDRDNAVVLLNRDHEGGKRRATLLHELLHLHCPGCDDDEIEEATALALVPAEHVTAVALGHLDVETVADRAAVDPQLVRARLISLVADDASAVAG